MSETVLYRTEGHVATITLNRPDALNAFTSEMRAALADATATARDDASVRVVILSGEGRCFSAGADLKAGFGNGADVKKSLMDEYRPSLVNIAEMEKPVISAVHGFAAGVGLSYAMVCDLTVMARGAFLLLPFSTIGLVPDGGSTWLMARTMGYKRAYEAALENQRLSADKCEALGLVNRIADDDVVFETANEWAEHLATKAPLALGRTKKLMRMAADIDYVQAIAEEAALQELCIDSADSKEGIAAFLEKRVATFTGA